MALTSCPECKGQVSDGAAECPHCGHPIGSAWGACPECKGPISATQETCKECGFPLRQPAEEPPAAMMFAVVGLLVPLFALLALAQSRRGSAARRLAWIGIALWIAGMIFVVAVARRP